MNFEHILFTHAPKEALDQALAELKPDRVAFLVDENTKAACLPLFGLEAGADVIMISSGEVHKNLSTCEVIWKALTDRGFTRKSLLVNVGGGVIGDMGGFAAATYKRGIRFINFPTTLLAMVDANIGGKLGIDFHGFKNHIGLFQDPEKVIVYEGFLRTLPARELRSGFAEVIKHGLIRDRAYWDQIRSSDFPHLDWTTVVKRSIEIKHEVVTIDPKEQGLRKILNFGHTLGHAIETWYLTHGQSLLHGEAIAAGMILEANLSVQLGLLGEEIQDEIAAYLHSVFGKTEIPPQDALMALMLQDKKNLGREISFSLLDAAGNCVFDRKVDEKMISNAISHYTAIK